MLTSNKTEKNKYLFCNEKKRKLISLVMRNYADESSMIFHWSMRMSNKNDVDSFDSDQFLLGEFDENQLCSVLCFYVYLSLVRSLTA